jgi:CDP-paratose 2-epimerase
MIKLYFDAASNFNAVSGEAFNIGGGMENSLSILELFSLIGKELDTDIDYHCNPPRESDQKIFVANTQKINAATGWEPDISAASGISRMLDWIRESH